MYICDRCNKIFERKSRLKTHMRLHFPRWHKCRYCGKRFWKRTNFVYHERIHLGERPYSCSSCYKTFIQKSDLVEHEKTHVNRPALRNQSVVSVNEPSAETNARAGQVFKCGYCKKSFNHRRNLFTHMKTHLASKCEVCHELLMNQAERVVHEQIHKCKYTRGIAATLWRS